MKLTQLGAMVTVLCLWMGWGAGPFPVGAAEVLFVGGQAGPTQGDDGFVFDRLEELGHNVTYRQASAARTSHGENVDLIVLSSTPGSGDLRGKFQDLATPILNWEEAIMRWVHESPDGNIRTAESSDNGSDQTTDLVNIVNPDHCLAAGFPAGELVVADDFIAMPNVYNELAEGTVVIAEIDSSVAQQDPIEAVLTAIETGGMLGPDSAGDVLPSPGPRVNFFVVDTGFGSLNENGVALFDAAVEWLLNGGRCGGVVAPALEAGDANMDLKFDQLDLVQVQIAAKYLTGQAATWGDGDWNGAPGGSVGDPPQGDGQFNQLDIVAALNAGKYLTGPYAALAGGSGTIGDGQTSIVYNVNTGEVQVDAPAGTNLTSVNIESASGIFTGALAQNLGGSFDNDTDTNIFKATFGSSFGSISFGNVAQPGLSRDDVTSDLTVVGSLAGGGDLGNVDLVYVPEPSTLLLALLGLLSLTAATRSGPSR